MRGYSRHISVAILLCCYALFFLDLSIAQGNEEPQQSNSFTIERDPKLGDPLLTLRKPPKDKQGRVAIDVLEEFLKHLREGKDDEAKKLCRFSVIFLDGRSIRKIRKSNLPNDPKHAEKATKKLQASEALFPEYAKKLQNAKRYTLGATVKQKGEFWTIQIRSEGLEKDMMPERLYLSFVNGEWKIEISDLAFRLRQK